MHEIKSPAQRARRHAVIESRYGAILGSTLEASERNEPQQAVTAAAEIVDLTARRSAMQ